MQIVTAIINDEPLPCVVTDRGVAPVAQLDPTLPSDLAALQSEEVRPDLVAAVEAADSALFVPVETVTFAD